MSAETVQQSALEHDLTTKHAGYHVWQSVSDTRQVDRTILTIHIGIATVQDYLTPDQADELGNALKEHAAYARSAEALADQARVAPETL